MIVLTMGGTRLIDTEEVRVIPWAIDTRKEHSGFIPIENYGWTNCIPESKWRWAAAALSGLSRSNAIQLSRMCKTYDEADTLFKGYARSLAPTFFYDENLERKAEKSEKESTSKSKALPKTAEPHLTLATESVKDAIVTAEW